MKNGIFRMFATIVFFLIFIYSFYMFSYCYDITHYHGVGLASFELNPYDYDVNNINLYFFVFVVSSLAILVSVFYSYILSNKNQFMVNAFLYVAFLVVINISLLPIIFIIEVPKLATAIFFPFNYPLFFGNLLISSIALIALIIQQKVHSIRKTV